jgi:hypothetical protein
MPAAKPIKAVKGHRTKAEKDIREQAEESLKTGNKLTERMEVKNNPVAHQEFIRVKELLGAIDKDDDLYSAIINRYCLIQSECLDFEQKIADINNKLNALENDYDNDKIEAEFYYKTYDSINKYITNYDRQIMAKRKMLFDIEKENIMTVAAGLRSIPKNPTQAGENPLLKALNDDD